MKNKKGFTMIELLGIITIIGVLLIMTVPNLTTTLKKSTEKDYDNFIDNLLIAAETYVENNRDLYPSLDNPEGRALISIQTLIDNDLIKKIAIDPKTKEKVPTYNIITVSKGNDGTITYAYNSEDVSINGYTNDGLILLYDGYNKPVNNIWKDLSGNNNDGVLKGFDSNSWKGDNLTFDGIDDYIDLNDKLAKIFNSSNTIEMVIYFEPTQIKSVLIGNYPNPNNINIEKGESTLQSKISYNNQTVNYMTANNFYELGKITSSSYVFDKINKTFKFYYNSNYKDQVINNEFASNYNFKSVKIGTDNRENKSEVNLKGKLYSVRIYDRALTQEEITKNHSVDQARFGIE